MPLYLLSRHYAIDASDAAMMLHLRCHAADTLMLSPCCFIDAADFSPRCRRR